MKLISIFFPFNKKVLQLLVFTMLAVLTLSPVHASETDGTIDATNKYAWSENIGWLNFGTGVGAGDVHVTDAGLTGYVWSEQKGWIHLAPTNSGVTIDSAGNLSGFAWGEQTGYIDFGNASIDENGIFHGTSTNVITGTITFDCTNCLVETDYRPTDFRSTGGGGGGRRSIHDPVQVIQETGGSLHGAPGEEEVAVESRPPLGLFQALNSLMSWMEPTDYHFLNTPSKKKVKRHLGMLMRNKNTIKLLATFSGYSDGYLYLKPLKSLENVADLSKSLMISFSGCFSSSEMERAVSHDVIENPAYWWAGYWHFLSSFLTDFLKEEYQMWDGVEDINVFVLLDRFSHHYCEM